MTVWAFQGLPEVVTKAGVDRVADGARDRRPQRGVILGRAPRLRGDHVRPGVRAPAAAPGPAAGQQDPHAAGPARGGLPCRPSQDRGAQPQAQQQQQQRVLGDGAWTQQRGQVPRDGVAGQEGKSAAGFPGVTTTIPSQKHSTGATHTFGIGRD